MKLLDRYLIRQFAINFLLILASLIAIYLLIDVFERLDNFQDKQLPVGVVLHYFLAKIVVIYDQMAPVCLLLAGIVTLGLLMNRLELQTLNAGGISKARVMRPLLFVVLICTIFSVAIAQWLLPQASNKVDHIWRVKVQGQTLRGIVRDGKTFYRGQEGIYTFTTVPGQRYTFTDFRYITLTATGKMLASIYAKRATVQGNKWFLAQGYRHFLIAEGGMGMDNFSHLDIVLPNQPDDFFAPVQVASTLPLSELVRRARGADSRRQDMVNLQQRLSFIFLGVPLLLIALPLMLRFQQSRGRINLALAVPASAGLAFLAWGAWSSLEALSSNGALSPIIASWSIHLACLLLGMVMLWRRTRS